MPCPTSGLRVTAGAAGAAAGSMYLKIDFTNTSGRTCTLDGYPGVALTTSTRPGTQVGAAATRSDSKPKAVISLAPGETADATLQITQVLNYPAAACEPRQQPVPAGLPAPARRRRSTCPIRARGCTKPVFVLGITTVESEPKDVRGNWAGLHPPSGWERSSGNFV